VLKARHNAPHQCLLLPGMDQSAFYGVVAATNFTLLGLWWVAIKDRDDLTGRDGRGSQMAYLVSLQFVVAAAVSLFAQVAPDVAAVWRTGFAFAGMVGAIGIVLLALQFSAQTAARVMPWILAGVGVPLYLLVFAVAAIPAMVTSVDLALSPIEVEGLLLSIIVILGVQEAWFVAMTPRREVAPAPSDSIPSDPTAPST
jgi:cytochrome bd-type quinol oxidase subunit 2